jgi:hypothetical protein
MAGEAAIADFAIKAIMGISSGITAKAQASATNTVNSANAYASNLVRAANNDLRTSRNRLARYTLGVNNARVMENTGSALEAATINYRRAKDSATSDDFESQIAFAEQAGAQSAAAALSGLTGGVADIVNGTTALRKARLQQRSEQAAKQGDWDAGQRASQIAQAGFDSLDSSEVSDDLDYSLDVAVKQVRAGNLYTDIMGQQSVSNMANAFSFNTPKPSANTAQQSFRQSEIKAQNAGY